MKEKMHIFVSYTMYDDIINIEFLTKIKVWIGEEFTSFIDLIDNNSINPQERVFEELEKADFLYIIDSPSINNSLWVQKEIEIAHKRKIPIKKILPLSVKPVT